MNYTLLKRLIYPITIEEFFSEYWEKKVLYIPRNDQTYYEDILTFQDVNDYLSQTDIRYPHVRLVQNGKELPLVDYSYDFVYGDNTFQGIIDMDKLFHYYNEGATMSFQLLQKSIKKLSAFSNSIEQELEFLTQTNLFLTPPKSQGFTAHYDTHSFFILHLHGEKQWKIYEESKPLPLLVERIYDEDVEIVKPPILTPVLRPGDFMYVPRGIYHEAEANINTTLQITLGIFPKNWRDVFLNAIDQISEEEINFRKAPNPNDLKDAEKMNLLFKGLCKKLSDKVNPLDVFEKFKNKTFTNQNHDTSNRLNDLEKLPNLSKNTRVVRRKVKTRLNNTEDNCIIKFYDKEISFPVFTKPTLNFIVDNDEFSIAEMKGDLSIEDKLMIAETLISEGVLTVK